MKQIGYSPTLAGMIAQTASKMTAAAHQHSADVDKARAPNDPTVGFDGS